jgi:hypothetical protein
MISWDRGAVVLGAGVFTSSRYWQWRKWAKCRRTASDLPRISGEQEPLFESGQPGRAGVPALCRLWAIRRLTRTLQNHAAITSVDIPTPAVRAERDRFNDGQSWDGADAPAARVRPPDDLAAAPPSAIQRPTLSRDGSLADTGWHLRESWSSASLRPSASVSTPQ